MVECSGRNTRGKISSLPAAPQTETYIFWIAFAFLGDFRRMKFINAEKYVSLSCIDLLSCRSLLYWYFKYYLCTIEELINIKCNHNDQYWIGDIFSSRYQESFCKIVNYYPRDIALVARNVDEFLLYINIINILWNGFQLPVPALDAFHTLNFLNDFDTYEWLYRL